MTSTRWLILILGPPLIVGVLYWSTMRGAEQDPAVAPSPRESTNRAAEPYDPKQQALKTGCRRKAEEIRPRLSARCRMIIRPPYVLAGDLSETELDRHYRRTILPTSRALITCYFDRRPDEPITILIFSGDRSYQEHAERFDGGGKNSYNGYYQRSDRRIVLNIATGNGTLAHELTHALAHFDFPEMPEWFDEGLASLYEQSQFSDDGLRIEGISNWRLHYLLPAIRRNRLKLLETLVETTIRGKQEAVDYAHARYFCLYLQHRRLLCPFYRKFRAASERDPTGLMTLRELLHADSLDGVDRDFRAWVSSLRFPGGGAERRSE